jgi:UPF0042 nucleotide-binding protein
VSVLPEIVLITGTSGSGKSVALHALEDAGFYCVDNLPPELLESFVALERHRTPVASAPHRIAVAMDVRSADSLYLVPKVVAHLTDAHTRVQLIFLDSSTQTLIRRFSETRRKHPLSDHLPAQLPQGNPSQMGALEAAIEVERELLADLREKATVIDTSLLSSAQLRAWVKQVVQAPSSHLTLVFESFAFKMGVPLDADFVFDVRSLPNPHYVPDLKALTGQDPPVITYLQQQEDVGRMLADIEEFLVKWLPSFEKDHRSYLTVAIGCTGGQHRSVYMVEQLYALFIGQVVTLKRHRELDGRTHSGK